MAEMQISYASAGERLMAMNDAMSDYFFRHPIKKGATIDSREKVQVTHTCVKGISNVIRRVTIKWNLTGHCIVQHLTEDGLDVRAIYVGHMEQGRASGPGVFIVFKNNSKEREESVGTWFMDTMQYGKFKTSDRIELGKFHLGTVQGIVTYRDEADGTFKHVRGTFQEGEHKSSSTEGQKDEDREDRCAASVEIAQNAIREANTIRSECFVATITIAKMNTVADKGTSTGIEVESSIDSGARDLLVRCLDLAGRQRKTLDDIESRFQSYFSKLSDWGAEAPETRKALAALYLMVCNNPRNDAAEQEATIRDTRRFLNGAVAPKLVLAVIKKFLEDSGSDVSISRMQFSDYDSFMPSIVRWIRCKGTCELPFATEDGTTAPFRFDVPAALMLAESLNDGLLKFEENSRTLAECIDFLRREKRSLKVSADFLKNVARGKETDAYHGFRFVASTASSADDESTSSASQASKDEKSAKVDEVDRESSETAMILNTPFVGKNNRDHYEDRTRRFAVDLKSEGNRRYWTVRDKRNGDVEIIRSNYFVAIEKPWSISEWRCLGASSSAATIRAVRLDIGSVATEICVRLDQRPDELPTDLKGAKKQWLDRCEIERRITAELQRANTGVKRLQDVRCQALEIGVNASNSLVVREAQQELLTRMEASPSTAVVVPNLPRDIQDKAKRLSRELAMPLNEAKKIIVRESYADRREYIRQSCENVRLTKKMEHDESMHERVLKKQEEMADRKYMRDVEQAEKESREREKLHRETLKLAREQGVKSEQKHLEERARRRRGEALAALQTAIFWQMLLCVAVCVLSLWKQLALPERLHSYFRECDPDRTSSGFVLTRWLSSRVGASYCSFMKQCQLFGTGLVAVALYGTVRHVTGSFLSRSLVVAAAWWMLSDQIWEMTDRARLFVPAICVDIFAFVALLGSVRSDAARWSRLAGFYFPLGTFLVGVVSASWAYSPTHPFSCLADLTWTALRFVVGGSAALRGNSGEDGPCGS
eukprot:g583.t1